ncbi:MAG: hypothetical protein LLF94_12520 [Chlamydiales bacterium]|nr:hypothetical protein [Chlamydiales bacterium]
MTQIGPKQPISHQHDEVKSPPKTTNRPQSLAVDVTIEEIASFIIPAAPGPIPLDKADIRMNAQLKKTHENWAKGPKTTFAEQIEQKATFFAQRRIENYTFDASGNMIAKQNTPEKESVTASKEHKSTKSAQKIIVDTTSIKKTVQAVDTLAGRNSIHSPRGPYSKGTENQKIEQQLETERQEASDKSRIRAKKTEIEKGKDLTRENRIERHRPVS